MSHVHVPHRSAYADTNTPPRFLPNILLGATPPLHTVSLERQQHVRPKRTSRDPTPKTDADALTPKSGERDRGDTRERRSRNGEVEPIAAPWRYRAVRGGSGCSCVSAVTRLPRYRPPAFPLHRTVGPLLHANEPCSVVHLSAGDLLS